MMQKIPHSPDSMLALQRGYAEHLRLLLVEIVQLKNTLAKEQPQPANLQSLYQLVHNLCGSGTTFGFPAISHSGHDLVVRLKDCAEAAPANLPALLRDPALLEDLEIFERACHRAIMSETQLRPDAVQASTPATAADSKTVCILSAKEDAANDLDQQLRHFGYRVSISHDAQEYRQAVHDYNPDVMIIFSELAEGDAKALKDIVADVPPQAQLILLCPHDTFEGRLAAVRLGAKGFFAMPVDVLQIIDKIEQLVEKYNSAPSYHVLIVDDDEMLMKFYTLALERAGILTTSVSSPKEALEVIADQAIDLVMIDFLMPYCNGQELAAIIRQHEKYVSLPIIFMSARDDVETLLRDTGLGIDDFLVKPITADQLVSVVKSRAQRSAELQVLMARDSFTGLLNHGHFMDMLAMEMGQVKRYRTNAAYAIIDIDHFKNINDTYGHIAGDHVIKGLARMLQQRLRRSDIIGRCGGEEFGIIMPDCDIQNASLIVESMRLQFEGLTFRMDQHDIRVTFSAGLANLAEYENVDALIKAADSALYDAKRQGRNRLILA
ncbi:MAG: diguanylate cyclase [Proteobacteria bacterium]|nr:diguanylate cyclase [Pseudomonadota bacterium]